MESSKNDTSIHNFEKTVDLIIRLTVLFLLLVWCFDILQPFLLMLVWAIVIAIAVYPLYKPMVKIFLKKTILTSIVLIILLLSVLVIPSVLVTKSFYEGISHLHETYVAGQP